MSKQQFLETVSSIADRIGERPLDADLAGFLATEFPVGGEVFSKLKSLCEEGEAEGKWKRAQLTSTQLSTYLVGYLEVKALRDAAQAREGFDEKAFHDALLAHGSPPPRHLKALLGL